MKKALLMTMALVLMAIPAAGQQSGYLGLFEDIEGTDCGISEVDQAVIRVYVVHLGAPEAQGAEFGFDFSGVPNLEFLSWTAVAGNIVLADPDFFGFSVAYGPCAPLPRALMYLQFLTGDPSAPCSQLRMDIHPNPNINAIQIVDCNETKIPVEGRGIFINPTDDCNDCSEAPVGTEIDTWGSLKSLYR